jgi:hypothetical protein
MDSNLRLQQVFVEAAQDVQPLIVQLLASTV